MSPAHKKCAELSLAQPGSLAIHVYSLVPCTEAIHIHRALYICVGRCSYLRMDSLRLAFAAVGDVYEAARSCVKVARAASERFQVRRGLHKDARSHPCCTWYLINGSILDSLSRSLIESVHDADA